jgi:hypothetical protein
MDPFSKQKKPMDIKYILLRLLYKHDIVLEDQKYVTFYFIFSFESLRQLFKLINTRAGVSFVSSNYSIFFKV